MQRVNSVHDKNKYGLSLLHNSIMLLTEWLEVAVCLIYGFVVKINYVKFSRRVVFVFVEIMIENSVMLARCSFYVRIFCFLQSRSFVFMKVNCLYQHYIVFEMLNLVINFEINKVKIKQ
jgi:hypothetical protein